LKNKLNGFFQKVEKFTFSLEIRCGKVVVVRVDGFCEEIMIQPPQGRKEGGGKAK